MAEAFFFMNLGCVLKITLFLDIEDLDKLMALNSEMRLGAASRTRKITLLKNIEGLFRQKFLKCQDSSISKTLSRFHDGKTLGVRTLRDLVYCSKSLMYGSLSISSWGSSSLSGLVSADLYWRMEV